MEDLDASGFPVRKQFTNWNDIEICINWLAHFHAQFIDKKPNGLWKNGTYWHLDTRPDELTALKSTPLKKAAHKIDTILKQCQFKTILHGDAKLENFCFSNNSTAVAAVDFQYTGGGCGMKDLVYFAGSCLSEEECEAMEEDILNTYFKSLFTALSACGSTIAFNRIEEEWRKMYPYAWTDFYRFLSGWNPAYCRNCWYSEKLLDQVLIDLS